MGSQAYEYNCLHVYTSARWRAKQLVTRYLSMISGIVLAAGASSRMGQAKAAMPFGASGETVLSRIVSTILAGGVPEVVVVAGAHIDAVRQAMPRNESRARVIEHPGWEQGQLSSLIAGLDAIDQPLLEAALVTPVDVPLVTPFTVAAVVSAWRRARAPIVRPVDGERHGHPVIFDRCVFDASARGGSDHRRQGRVRDVSRPRAECGSERRRRVRGHRHAGGLRTTEVLGRPRTQVH